MLMLMLMLLLMLMLMDDGDINRRLVVVAVAVSDRWPRDQSRISASALAAVLAREAAAGHFLLFFEGGSFTESWELSSSVPASLSSVGLGVALLLLSSFVGIESFVSSQQGGAATAPAGVDGLSSESSVKDVVVLLSSRTDVGAIGAFPLATVWTTAPAA
jgi:hypothetical protein